MGCTFGLDMYIGTLCIGDGNCDKAEFNYIRMANVSISQCSCS